MSAEGLLDVARHHWPRYCEECVWHLCGELPACIEDAAALIVSNAQRGVALWQQRAAPARDRPIAWDYHVVLIGRVEDRWWIWDPDSTLPCPVPALTWLDATFPPIAEAHARFRPRFRLVPAATYRSELRSDRRHMRRRDGSWRAPPPPGPPIGEGSNLMQLVDVTSEFLGERHDLASLRSRLSGVPAP